MEQELKVSTLDDVARLAKEAADAEATDPGEPVKLPVTGIVVRLRRADTQGDALTGGLPLSLVAAAMDETTKTNDMTPELVKEISRGMIFMRQTVVENCLEPKIGFDLAGRVSYLDGSRQAIARVNKADFQFMFAFITGQEARDALEKFRKGKAGRTTVAGANGEEFRLQTELGMEDQEQEVSS